MLIHLLALFISLTTNAQTLTPPDTALARYVPVQVQTHDGYTLGGHLALPKNAQPPFPAVLFLVGSGPGDRYEDVPAKVTADGQPALLFRPIEDALLARGIAVMTYDKRGITPTDDTFFRVNINSSTWSTSTANNLAADAVSAFDTLKAQAQIDLAHLGVLGHSEGTILALKVAEQRGSDIKTLLMLGLLTRSMAEIFVYQGVTDPMRTFSALDADRDGYLTQSELELARTADPVLAAQLNWAALQTMDKTGDGRVSEQEFRFALEDQLRGFIKTLNDTTTPLPPNGEPRDWYRQYFAEGAYLPRQLKFCSKMHLFQGEVDIQTPFEDALQLDSECKTKGTPLASFISYPNEGHGFSPRIGYRGSRDTIGPIDTKLPGDIAAKAAEDLIAPSLLVNSEVELKNH